MAKKKTQAKQQPMSPEKYIRERGRTLPIERCYISGDWEKAGEASIIVVRRHPQGTYTLGNYLVDFFCRGVIDTLYKFSIPEYELKELIAEIGDEAVPTDYTQVHNLIYGAISFAEEAGIAPHKSFALTRYLLEEDTDDIPLIEYDFGKDGKHFLVARSRFEANQYLPLLKKNLGTNFTYTIMDDTPEESSDLLNPEDEGDIDIKEAMEAMTTMIKKTQNIVQTPYAYQHPEYPNTCSVDNEWLIPLLYDPQNSDGLTKEQIEKILVLPHDSLRRDLEQIILFETGCTCDEISSEQWGQKYSAQIAHALFLLGEVGDENSLKVVLETLRQNEAYYDYHFGDIKELAYIPTLYLLGKDQLPALLDFAKEPGLYTYAHYMVFPAVALIALRHPERRAEVIEWFRQVLRFYTEKLPETTYCDGILTGLMISDLMDIQAKELLPEIKALYDTGLVDNGGCGNYQVVEKSILLSSPYPTEYMLDIYERYEEYRGVCG